MKKSYVIKKPLITEKGSISQQTTNQYCFAVDIDATKNDIRTAVEDFFKVNVRSIRTLIMPAKYKRVGKNVGRTSEWKKAVVTLAEGERLEFLESA